MPFELENLGEQVLKGFDDPVRVYRVELSPGESLPSPQQKSHRQVSLKSRGLMAVIAVVVLGVAGGIAYWSNISVPQEEPASLERMAFPLPDKPSIAVLPFLHAQTINPAPRTVRLRLLRYAFSRVRGL
jgi:adenylate cyclase